MAVRQYPIVLDGLPRVTILPFRARGIIVTNESGVSINVTDDAGKTFTTPPGGRMAFNSGLCASPTIVSSAAGTGTAEVEFHSQPVDTAGSTPGSQTVANFPSVQNVNISGQSLTLTANDVIVEQNTGVLTGLLPSSTTPIVANSGTPVSVQFAAAVPGFGLQGTFVSSGRLTVFVVSGGSTVYLLRNAAIFVGSNAGAPVNKRFAEPIAKNDVLWIAWNDSVAAASFVLRV